MPPLPNESRRATAAETRSRGRPSDPARRDAVLEAAKEALAERGFEAAGIRDIAGRLGLRSRALYHHFASKEEILFEIVQEVYARSLKLLDRVRGIEESPVAALRELMRGHIDNITADTATTELALNEYKSLSLSHARAIDAEHRAYLGGFRELIRGGQDQRLLRSDIDPELATLVIVGALNSTVRWYRGSASRPAAEVADAFVGILLEGLTGPIE
jgi:TetR/AcrR family transcriptional regulator, cholesterol catabolism regulator